MRVWGQGADQVQHGGVQADARSARQPLSRSAPQPTLGTAPTRPQDLMPTRSRTPMQQQAAARRPPAPREVQNWMFKSSITLAADVGPPCELTWAQHAQAHTAAQAARP